MREPILTTSCGECFVCCHALSIDDPQLHKQAGVLCGHCSLKGCGIYETRPAICRSFYCGWRLVAELGDAWRPDRSGVLILIAPQAKDLPEEYRDQQHGMTFLILGGESAILRPGFAEYLATLVSRKVPVYMSVNTPTTPLNPHLVALAAVKDIGGVRKMLLHIFGLHMELKRQGSFQALSAS